MADFLGARFILQFRGGDLRGWGFSYSAGNAVLFLTVFYVFVKAGKVFLPSVPGFLSSALFLLLLVVSFFPILQSLVKVGRVGQVQRIVVFIGVLAAALILPLVMHRFFLVDRLDHLGRSPLDTAASLSVFSLCWVIIGAVLQRAMLPYSNSIGFVALVVPLILVLPSIGSDFVIDYRLLNAGRSDGLEFNHLVLGETVGVLVLFAIAISQGYLRVVAIGLAVFVLFALGGRTALFSIVPTLLVFFAVKRQLTRYLPVLFFLVFVPLVFFLIVYADFILESTALSRMLIIGGLGDENSFVLRSEFIKIGLHALPDQILFGDPTFLVDRLGTVGAYMHNILSAWQFWGFFTFFYILVCCLIVLIGFWRYPFLANDAVGDFALITFLYGFVCVLSGKHVGFDLFWLGLGMGLARVASSSQRESVLEE